MSVDIDAARSELADPNTLRVGVNLGNILLVTGETPAGDPVGVSPDLSAAIADRLGVAVSYVTYASAGDVADGVMRDDWDIGLIAVEPKRAETISFCRHYSEIVATYLVPEGSPLQAIEDVDKPGVRIAVADRAAYDLYLSRTIKHAELCRAKGLPCAFKLFVDEKLDALAGLEPALLDNAKELPGSRVLPGRYTSVMQTVGTKPGNANLKALVEEFLDEARKSGLVGTLIEKHGVVGRLHPAAG